jgi:hypothetical protein
MDGENKDFARLCLVSVPVVIWFCVCVTHVPQLISIIAPYTVGYTGSDRALVTQIALCSIALFPALGMAKIAEWVSYKLWPR